MWGLTENTEVVPPSDYVITPYLERLVERASLFLEAGLPLHLRGPAGVGKTSLALYLAARQGRQVHVIYGNEAFRGFDLVGKVSGLRQRAVLDNFIHSVEKRTEEIDPLWTDGRLLRAVQQGGTLIYDEFTRSRAEANNVLLSILEEGVIEIPHPRLGPQLAQVHPDFRIILTSNPEEYAGVHKSQDALRDRMVTVDMVGRDSETDAAIVARRSQLSPSEAAKVVAAVRSRLSTNRPDDNVSLRPAIMVARVLQRTGIPADPWHPEFEQICNGIAGPPQNGHKHA